jgi:5-formyltetrahydrofolate cyclo-ligase
MQKDELRKLYQVKRKYLNDYQREQFNNQILENFLEEWGNFESFFVYYSFGTEADTHHIVQELLLRGKRVYLPRVEGDSLVAVPYGELRTGAFGIAEPVGQAFMGQIDVAVVPLLAVNDLGYRLGYGGGYYDRFLKGNPIKRVGLAYDLQRTAERFEEEWDEPLDGLVTEKNTYSFQVEE